MYRVYKYRIYPNKTQQKILNQWFETGRIVYNSILQIKVLEYEKYKRLGKDFNSYGIKWISEFDICKQITEAKKENEYLKSVPAASLNYVSKQVFAAFKLFFNNGGYPKFKKMTDKQNLTFRMISQTNTIEYENKKINIPKLPGIKAKFHRKIEEEIFKIKTLSISKDQFGKYYCSIAIAFEKEIPIKIAINNPVGIDLGITHSVILSTGEKIDNPKIFEKNFQKLKQLQQKLSTKEKSSSRYRKVKKRISKCYSKIHLQREHFIHTVTNQLTNNFDGVFTEDLDIKKMTKSAKGTINRPGESVKQKAGLNRRFLDVSPHSIIEKLEYKSNFKGIIFEKIGRFELTSKICNNCGFKNKNLKLEQREWKCPNCENDLDRDINAAKNVLKLGLEKMQKLNNK